MDYTSTLKSDFDKQYSVSNIYVRRAEKYAAWTVASIFPQETSSLTAEFQTDYQSLGAEAVETLVNKTMQAVFPVGRPFFRYDATMQTMAEFQAAGLNPEAVNDTVAAAERKGMKDFEAKGARSVLTEVVRLAIVTGQCLYKTGDQYEYWDLHEHVAFRDCNGKPIRFIIKEKVDYDELPKELQELYKGKYPVYVERNKRTDICMYTDVCRKILDSGKAVWKLRMAAEDCEKDYDNIQWSDDDVPYHLVDWQLPKGRKVAVGQVELYSGDIHALSRLNKALVPRLALACRLVMLADPTGVTKAANVNQAQDGQVVPGRQADLAPVNWGEFKSFAELSQYMQPIVERVSRAFLMTAGTVRQAERVTAEEIRMLANELEARLGGAYTRLVNSLQIPVARDLTRTLKIPVDNKFIEITIITGIDALSRNAEQENLLRALSQLTVLNNVPPEILARINKNAVISSTFRNNGLLTTEYVLDKPDMQTETTPVPQGAV